MKPQYLELEHTSVIAVSGQSGSGKTNTVVFYIIQLLLHNSAVLVCDPHKETNKDSLSKALEPVQHAFTLPIAGTHDDILHAFRVFKHEFERRLARGTDEYYCLILDETPAFFLQLSKEESTEIANLLVRVANEGRKVRMRVFLLGQNWNKQFIGNTAIRSSINAILFHRTSEHEAMLFLPSLSATQKRMIAGLRTGEMIVVSPLHQFVHVHVPYIPYDDIVAIVPFIRDRVSMTRVRNAPRAVDGAPRHDDSVYSRDPQYDADYDLSCTDDDDARKRKNFSEIAGEHTVQKLHALARIILADTMNKEQAIYHVFGIKKAGRSKKWHIASAVYDKVKKYVKENT